MADVNKSISIAINVINNAKGEFQKVAGAVKQATEEVEKNTKAVAGSASNWKDTAKGVFTGVAAYDALKKGVSMATDFLKSSIQESMNAEAAMARVKNNVENAGFAYDSISPKLKDYSDRMVKMGFDDEETAESVSKLMIVTKDYDEALKLNQLAMDLSRNKGIKLEDATKSLAAVMQGAGGKALQQYGLSFKDGASAAEILNQLQEKVKNSAIDFSNTTAGKLATVNEEWNNMKQKIGDDLSPVLLDLVKTFEQNMPAIQALVAGAVKVIEKMAKAIGFVVTAAMELGSVLGTGLTVSELNAKVATEDLTRAWNDSIAAYNKANKTAIPQVISATDSMTKEQMKASVYTQKLQIATDKASSSQIRAGAAGKDASKAMDEQKRTIEDLKNAWDSIASKINKFTFDSEADFQRFGDVLSDTKAKNKDYINDAKAGFSALSSKIQSVTSDIEGLNTKISDAQKGFQEFLTANARDSGRDFASIVNEAEQAIPDLKKRIAKAKSDGSDTEDLKKELEEKQSIIQSAKKKEFTTNVEFMNELKFLRENNDKNELEQAYALTQQKIADKKKETDELIANLQKEVDAKNSMKDQYVIAEQMMTAVFQEQVTLRIKKAQGEMATNYALNSSVTSLKNSYVALANAMERVNSLSGAKSTSVSTSSLSGKRADGGPVSGGSTYLVGERGPELFTPATSGSIVPNNKLGGGGGINVIINNPTVRSNDDLQQIINAVSKALGRQEELARYGSYK